jgi:hypothetical protein
VCRTDKSNHEPEGIDRKRIKPRENLEARATGTLDRGSGGITLNLVELLHTVRPWDLRTPRANARTSEFFGPHRLSCRQ